MVLVVFVIMLLNLGDEAKLSEKWNLRKIIAILFAFVLAIQFLSIYVTNLPDAAAIPESAALNGTVQSIGTDLFTNYLVQFEAIAVLLLAAIVGAMLLAKRKTT